MAETPADDPADRAHWARVAEDWIAWARASDHDAFWAYRRAFEGFVGRGAGAALEVGCGEGRVSRVLSALGWRVVASDAVERMVRAAEEADSAQGYAVGEASRLPFADGGFDLVVAYNVLMDLDDSSAALREIARVLTPDGRLLVSLVHPFVDRGRFAGPDDDAAFVVEGSYFGRRRFADTETRAGLSMAFAGWSQPLETYVAALAGAGLAVTGLREPVPDAPVRADRRRWCRLPAFLWLEARPRTR